MGKSQGVLKMGPARQITYKKASEEPDFLERDKTELISIEKSINKLRAEKGEDDEDGKENEEQKYTLMCNSSTTTSATEVMTETQYVKRLVSQGTSTNPPPLP